MNTANVDTTDAACPAAIQLEPARVLDVTSDDFLGDLFLLAQDLSTGDRARRQSTTSTR